jgi:hypothetical protein
VIDEGWMAALTTWFMQYGTKLAKFRMWVFRELFLIRYAAYATCRSFAKYQGSRII